MGEGALPGGVFRQSAPGEFEINIPGIAESPVNKLIRRAYNGKHKGEPSTLTRTNDDKLHPRGFTPPLDFISDPSKTYKQEGGGDQEIEVERGIFPNVNIKKPAEYKDAYLRLQEANLLAFDAATLQFRHLLEYLDTSQKSDLANPIVDGFSGNRPGLTYEFNTFTGEFSKNPIYLASFVKTHRENEDPTLLGFDFHVRLSNSPLFNGSLESFLILEGKQKGNLELANRIPLLKEFQKQFLNFFKTYDPNHLSENLPSVGQFTENKTATEEGETILSVSSEPSLNLTNGLLTTTGDSKTRPVGNESYQKTFQGAATKAYYVQSISGLGKLNEANDFGDSSQRFVKWQTDCLTITVNEDVSQNMGYLASLYKNLAWSRERGRLAVPENLLRFEVVLDITEIRNYTRVYQNKLSSRGNSSEVLVNTGTELDWIEIYDQTSKYRYFVHECQLFFPSMPHGDTLTNAPSEFIKGLDLKIYFKNSNLRFMKFNAPQNVKVEDNDYTSYLSRYKRNALSSTDDFFRIKVVDNSNSFVSKDSAGDPTITGGTSDSPRKTIFDDGNGDPTGRNTSPITYPIEIFKSVQDQQKDNVNDTGLSDEERRRQINQRPSFADKLKVGAKDMFKGIAKAALNTGINLLNQQLVNVASLVNRTLNQIYNSTPVVGGIKPPKNIYTKPNEFEQAYIDFIGPGLKTFFEDPMKFRKEGIKGETLEQRIQRGRQRNPNPRPGRDPVDYFQLANQGTPTEKNLKLKEIVDADPDLGNGFSGASQVPFLGNSADPGTNRTLKQIVDSNPGIGNGFSGASQVPFLGNSADPGTNRTLKQIVDSNPNLGIPGSLISINPSLGNNAESGTNLTLNQLVAQSPDLGLPGSNIPNNPSLGNNADTGVNLPLQTIVDKDPDLGFPGSNIPQNPSLGNNAQVTSTNLTLQQLVDNDPDFGNNAGISIIPSLGNNADFGDNVNNNLTVSQNSVVKNPFLGNSGLIGNNTPNDVTVNVNSGVDNPDEGNSAITGTNTINDIVVQSNTVVTDADEGNSALSGDNVSNDIVVQSNTVVIDADEGNSALDGNNIENEKLVDTKSVVVNPELGNKALVNKNIENSKLVKNQSKVENSSLGNSSLTGINLPSDKLVKNESDVVNSNLGNSGQDRQNQKIDNLISEKSQLDSPFQGNGGSFGDNNKLSELIEIKTTLNNPSLGNSGELGVNNPKNVTIDGNSKLMTPEVGNSGLEKPNIDKDIIIRNNTQIEETNVGNSARFGANQILSDRVSSNSNLKDESQGNSAILGYNTPQEVKVDNFTSLKTPQLGNSSLSGNNLTQDSKVDQYSKSTNPDFGNSASAGKTKTVDEIVDKQSKLENSSQANSGLRGKNLNLNEFSKYSQSRVYGTVDWNNIQFPKSANRFPPPTTEK
jgi:hypothetical protein